MWVVVAVVITLSLYALGVNIWLAFLAAAIFLVIATLAFDDSD